MDLHSKSQLKLILWVKFTLWLTAVFSIANQILWTFPTIKVVSKCENFDKCANSFKAHNFILWKKSHLFLKREKISPQKQLKDLNLDEKQLLIINNVYF